MLASRASASDATPPASGDPTIEDVRGSIGLFGGALTATADGLDGGTLFGGGGAFYFTPNLGVEVSVQRRSQDIVATSANVLSGGSLDSTVISGGILARLPLNRRVAPYIVVGIAHSSGSYEVNPSVVQELAALNFRLSEDLDSKVGFAVAGGVDLLVASRFGVFGEVRYIAGGADTSAELADSVSGVTVQDTGSQDLNGLAVSGGIRVLF